VIWTVLQRQKITAKMVKINEASLAAGFFYGKNKKYIKK
tara:strand:- start:304 stop:420 length:117 start_codon:yes stop_codon:yes gene_type:complete